MLQFKRFTPADTETVRPYLHANTTGFSDLTLGYFAMWGEEMDIRWCIYHDTLIASQTINEAPAFFPPLGKDPAGALDALIEYAKAMNLPLRFYALNDDMVETLKQDERFDSVPAVYDLRWSDYVYSFEAASTFKGKKFSGQRNHINRYTRLYGEPYARWMEESDLPAVEAMLEEYEKEHSDRSPLEESELEGTRYLLTHLSQLHQKASCLIADGRIIAFSIGEIIGDMLFIHAEKALRSYKGVYPTMYRSFVCLVRDTYGPLSWVNREDDSGDLGLRTSKMQYQPVRQLHKYFTHLNSPAPIARYDTIDASHVILTPFKEEDRHAYYLLNTDKEVSRWWGYDYESDLNLTVKIDEDIFYDMTMQDMDNGDSVNYAIRESEDGEMIGEVIFWNMTINGDTEIGCRLFPEYQGKGYGTAAFTAAVGYIKNTLHRKPRAKCYQENTASAAMILASGLQYSSQDDTFFYYSEQ